MVGHAARILFPLTTTWLSKNLGFLTFPKKVARFSRVIYALKQTGYLRKTKKNKFNNALKTLENT